MGKAQTAKSKKAAKKRKTAEKSVSCKTPQVMKLVEDSKDENPVILAGKSAVPKQLRGKEPLSRLMKSGYGPVRADNSEEVEVVNIAELAIKLEAPEILDRFNACSCSKCVAIFTERVAQKVQPRFARVPRGSSTGAKNVRMNELYGRVEQMRKAVMPEMIREIMGKKKRWFHDE